MNRLVSWSIIFIVHLGNPKTFKTLNFPKNKALLLPLLWVFSPLLQHLIPTEAPFSACHDVVDVETALYNCKYDTCSCFDSSCACHAVKEYVKECQSKGVSGLSTWRDHATYCSE